MAGPLTLAQIASRLGGRVAGDPQTLIRQVGSLDHAAAEQITFLSNSKNKAKLAQTQAAAVILAPENEGLSQLPRIVADNPYAYFARVSQLFNPVVLQARGVHPSAVVSPSARLGSGVSIGAGCVIGDDVAIGDDSCLYPRVVVYPKCVLGKRVVAHAGVVIGADGFGIAREGGAGEGQEAGRGEGRWVKIPQIGGVRIGDDVEIGANSTIDRGAIDDTVIEEGVKIDNQVQIGHNVRIGAHSAIAGCVGIAGSAHIGRHCTLGGAAMIHGHIQIADHVHVSAGTLISRSLLKPGTYTGFYPFDEHEAWRRNAASLRRLGKVKSKGKKDG